MAKGRLKKILKAIMIGGGSILSLLCPALGHSLIVCGTAINPQDSSTIDLMSTAALNLQAGIAAAASMQSSVSNAFSNAKMSIAINDILNWLKSRPLVMVGGLLVLLLLFKNLFGRRKRR